jgi:hypothetical protein
VYCEVIGKLIKNRHIGYDKVQLEPEKGHRGPWLTPVGIRYSSLDWALIAMDRMREKNP